MDTVDGRLKLDKCLDSRLGALDTETGGIVLLQLEAAIGAITVGSKRAENQCQ